MSVNDGARQRIVEAMFVRLHPLMAWLAALFLLVIVGDTIVRDESPFATIFSVAGWLIWAVFVVEFTFRFVLSPNKRSFLRRNWWQIVFLVLPFLALFRFFLALRIARAGRLLSAAVRGTRSAATTLRSRLTTVAALTVMIVLLSANVLFEFAGIEPYSRALHEAALATMTGNRSRGRAESSR